MAPAFAGSVAGKRGVYSLLFHAVAIIGHAKMNLIIPLADADRNIAAFLFFEQPVLNCIFQQRRNRSVGTFAVVRQPSLKRTASSDTSLYYETNQCRTALL